MLKKDGKTSWLTPRCSRRAARKPQVNREHSTALLAAEREALYGQENEDLGSFSHRAVRGVMIGSRFLAASIRKPRVRGFRETGRFADFDLGRGNRRRTVRIWLLRALGLLRQAHLTAPRELFYIQPVANRCRFSYTRRFGSTSVLTRPRVRFATG